MATTVETVTVATDARCHATRCADSGCSLSLAGVPEPYVLLDLESQHSPALASQPHCDYLFIGGGDNGAGPWVAPIELTTGRKRASEFLAQLAGGAEIANRLLRQGAVVQFNPIAAHNGGLDSREIRKLRTERLRFRGERVLAQVVRCGSRLVSALNA